MKKIFYLIVTLTVVTLAGFLICTQIVMHRQPSQEGSRTQSNAKEHHPEGGADSGTKTSQADEAGRISQDTQKKGQAGRISQDTQKKGQASGIRDTQRELSAKAEKILSEMTLSEKIYQMFIVTPEQLTGVSCVTAAGNLTKTKLGQYPVGGLVYFSANLVSAAQTMDMLSNVQQFSREVQGVPLFLCVDEEGGRVERIAGNTGFHIEETVPMAEVSSEEEAYRCGERIGAYLSGLGFNVDFAPDADVLTNSQNTVIGDRSFGSDAQTVTDYAVAFSNGLHENGMMSTFKHFPGHGATQADTHIGYASADRTYEQLMETELRPFAAAQENGVDMVMAAHISLPAVLGDQTPCSLSKKMITEILRGELQYQGLIITDGLGMGAIAANYDAATVAVMAVKAGIDLLLAPSDLQAAYQGIYGAVKRGEISQKRIDRSVKRILIAKLKL